MQIYFKHKTGICSSRTNKAPQTLPLLDVQQPSALGNIFKSFSGLTNACCSNTENQIGVLRGKIQRLERWKMGVQRAGVRDELSQGGHQGLCSVEKAARSSQAAPTALPTAPGNIWSKGPQQWPREKLGGSPDRANFEKNRQLKAEAHHNSICSHPCAWGQAQTHELRSLANKKSRGRLKNWPVEYFPSLLLLSSVQGCSQPCPACCLSVQDDLGQRDISDGKEIPNVSPPVL